MENFKLYEVRSKRVKARPASTLEIVDTYNGQKVAGSGDYVVIDEIGRTILMKKLKFEQRFQEVGNDEPYIERLSSLSTL